MMNVHMFPGQGSQFVGMGKTLFEQFPGECAMADDVLGYSIKTLCLLDPEKQLGRTSYTQTAIYFVTCLAYKDALKRGEEPADLLMGHSLGLYAALFAAEVFDLETGLEIVAYRGQLMEAASDGAMLAVIGSGVERLAELLVQFDCTDVDVANDNSPTQVTLSSLTGGIERVAPLLEAEGFQCVRLPVSGPFHSRYMEPARVKFARFLMTKPLKEPCQYVLSTTSASRVGAEYLLEEMSFQLVRPVRWRQTLLYLNENYSNLYFTEFGPGQVLTRLTQQTLMSRATC